MGIFVLVFIGLLVLIVEHKVKLRPKYQEFSGKFTKYYIDFIAFLIASGVIFALLYLLALASLPEFLIQNIIIFAILYSLFVILPIKYFDELMKKIFND